MAGSSKPPMAKSSCLLVDRSVGYHPAALKQTGAQPSVPFSGQREEQEGVASRSFIAASRSIGSRQSGKTWLFPAPKMMDLYRGNSLIRNRAPLGPYSRFLPRAVWWSNVGGMFLMSEVPLNSTPHIANSRIAGQPACDRARFVALRP